MTKDEFKRQVIMQSVLHGIENQIIKEAFNCYAKEDKGYHQNEIGTVLNIANTLMVYKKENRSSEAIINFTHHSLLTSEYLCEKITPWVESIRETIFNQKEPPFENDIDKAISWIKKKAEEPLTQKEKKKRDILLKKIDEIEKLQVPWSVSYNIPILTYPGKKGYVEKVFADYPSDLSRLEKTINEIANATGFEKYSLTVFILTGIEPILSRVIVRHQNIMQRLPTGENLKRFNIALDIKTNDLTFEEIKKIYEVYRKQLRVSKKKFSQEKYRLYSRVKNMGGLPKKNKVVFWQKIATEFKYKEWRQAFTCYKRILKKIENQ